MYIHLLRIIGDPINFRRSKPSSFNINHTRLPIQGIFSDIKSADDEG